MRLPESTALARRWYAPSNRPLLGRLQSLTGKATLWNEATGEGLPEFSDRELLCGRMIANHAPMAYSLCMYTIIETPTFQRTAGPIWKDGEREAFINWIAENPEAGDVIPGTGGLRKVRWTRAGMGKRGGARVIYYNMLAHGAIWLVMVYAKAELDNIPTHILNQLREAIDNGN